MMSHDKQNETGKSKTKVDRDLDEQLEQTIPASDPPASTQPGGGRKRDDQAAWDEGTAPAKKS